MFLRSWQSHLWKSFSKSLANNVQQRSLPSLSSSSLIYREAETANRFSASNDARGPLSLLFPLGGLFLWSSFTRDKTNNAVRLEEGKNNTKKPGTIHVEKELLQQRKIFIIGSIDDKMAKTVVMDLMWLASQDTSNNEPVTIYIHSSGGLVAAGLAIHDVMRSMPCPVRTVCLGKAYSMAAILLASGTNGQRYCLPNSRVMIHQPSSSLSRSSASDVAIHAASVLSTHKKLVDIISSHTGQSSAIVQEAIDRDNYMSPEDAKKFGVVDVIGSIDLALDKKSPSTGNDDNKNKKNGGNNTDAPKADNNKADDTDLKNWEKNSN